VVAGLDLLPLRTHFGGRKALRQRQSTARWPGEGLSLEGFELHRGLSSPIETAGPLQPLATDPDLGHWYSFGEAGGLVAGTYLHGVFESGPWRRRWLNQLRQRRGLAALPENPPHHSRQRDALLERLADAFEAHVNLTPLLSP
jgi:adenosylcobyric acid synthase